MTLKQSKNIFYQIDDLLKLYDSFKVNTKNVEVILLAINDSNISYILKHSKIPDKLNLINIQGNLQRSLANIAFSDNIEQYNYKKFSYIQNPDEVLEPQNMTNKPRIWEIYRTVNLFLKQKDLYTESLNSLLNSKKNYLFKELTGNKNDQLEKIEDLIGKENLQNIRKGEKAIEMLINNYFYNKIHDIKLLIELENLLSTNEDSLLNLLKSTLVETQQNYSLKQIMLYKNIFKTIFSVAKLLKYNTYFSNLNESDELLRVYLAIYEICDIIVHKIYL